MPTPLGKKTHHCVKCGYSKTINYKSDVIIIARCPKCGGEMPMEHRSGILSTLLKVLRKI